MQNLEKFYLCGGAVRDELLGKKPKDNDFVVLVRSFDEMREEILRNGGKIFIEKPEYLTIRGHLPNYGAADFVLPRSDGEYSDGRRPDNTSIAQDLYQDSCRRDFTMNAMYKNLATGEMIDYHKGYQDLMDGMICCVGKAEDRIKEDSLRLIRAFRFSIVKDFIFDPSLLRLLRDSQTLKLLENVSAERIREEVYKCFAHNTPLTIGKFFLYPELFAHVFNSRTKLWLKPTAEEV